MAGGLVAYHMFIFVTLFSYSLYHLISSTITNNTNNNNNCYHSRPYHPLPTHSITRHLPLALALLALLAALAFSLFSPSPTSLHRFASLQSSAALLLFLVLITIIITIPSFPSDLLFFVAALAFVLLSSASSHSAAAFDPSDLQSNCAATSALISAASAAASLALALNPRLFLADLALAAALALQGLWSLHAGLVLYVDAFVPEGCHRLLHLGLHATRCDLQQSRLRAKALLDLWLVFYAVFVAVLVLVVYAAVDRWAVGVDRRRINNGALYEAVPTSSDGPVQMKPLSKGTAQA